MATTRGRDRFLARGLVVALLMLTVLCACAARNPPRSGGSGTVSVSVIGGGTVVGCGTMCTLQADSPGGLRLSAIPHRGWRVERWTGTSCSRERTCTVAVTNRAQVTVEFVRDPNEARWVLAESDIASDFTPVDFAANTFGAGEARSFAVVGYFTPLRRSGLAVAVDAAGRRQWAQRFPVMRGETIQATAWMGNDLFVSAGTRADELAPRSTIMRLSPAGQTALPTLWTSVRALRAHSSGVVVLSQRSTPLPTRAGVSTSGSVALITGDGDLLWQRTYPDVELQAIAVEGDTVFIAGIDRSALHQQGRPGSYTKGTVGLIFTAISAGGGEPSWSTKGSAGETAQINGLITNAHGGLIALLTLSESIELGAVSQQADNSDVAMASFDAEGELEWLEAARHPGSQAGIGIARCGDTAFVIGEISDGEPAVRRYQIDGQLEWTQEMRGTVNGVYCGRAGVVSSGELEARAGTLVLMAMWP